MPWQKLSWLVNSSIEVDVVCGGQVCPLVSVWLLSCHGDVRSNEGVSVILCHVREFAPQPTAEPAARATDAMMAACASSLIFVDALDHSTWKRKKGKVPLHADTRAVLVFLFLQNKTKKTMDSTLTTNQTTQQQQSTGTRRYIHFWTTCFDPFLVRSNTMFCLLTVYSFSRSCPKTVSRTREVFPTGSTTLLRLQLSRTRDCAHRSRHVGLLLFLFFFFFW